ncbi:MAG: SDR family oxidoreductase, partial [Chloroflexi bacterium]|nr:SDR family oxidoreductase [Chloroflexota bacterium]
MRVLFIGGTGNISTACVERALAVGHRVTILTRGRREAAYGGRVEEVVGDRDDPAVLAALGERRFDVVANFLGFRVEQIERDLEAFGGRCGQYVFISTASTYMKPPRDHVITESTPLHNPFWQYSRDKIACEERLLRAHRETGFPVTIVRPSYTYGGTWIPSSVGGHGYTVVGRMRRGQPIICHGDGQSLWVMTTSDDFAVGFVGLLGRVQAIGEAFHITSDEALTWDTLYRTIGQVAGIEPEIVYI